jgi:2-phosphosulfolactate phosphatase
MKVELHFTYAGLSESDLHGKTVVVIDVLRACTVICAAFRSGCREIIPVESAGDGSALLRNLDRAVTILAGERDGHKVDGFNLGNSPLEFTESAVKGKTIILASTNGTPALVLGSSGARMYAASFLNVSRVAEEVVAAGEETVIICSGQESRFTLEDAICGGKMISLLRHKASLVNDAATVARMLFTKHRNDLLSALRNCDHGRYLHSIGFGADLDVAAGVDTAPVLPCWDNGRLVAQPKN